MTPPNLRACRLARDISQEQLAKLAGVHVGSLCRWERGQRIPTVEQALRLAEILECPVEELWKERTP